MFIYFLNDMRNIINKYENIICNIKKMYKYNFYLKMFVYQYLIVELKNCFFYCLKIIIYIFFYLNIKFLLFK